MGILLILEMPRMVSTYWSISKRVWYIFPFFNPELFLDFGLLENNQHISLNNDLYFKFMSVTQTSLSQEWKDTIIVYKNSIASLPVKVEPQ